MKSLGVLTTLLMMVLFAGLMRSTSISTAQPISKNAPVSGVAATSEATCGSGSKYTPSFFIAAGPASQLASAVIGTWRGNPVGINGPDQIALTVGLVLDSQEHNTPSGSDITAERNMVYRVTPDGQLLVTETYADRVVQYSMQARPDGQVLYHQETQRIGSSSVPEGGFSAVLFRCTN